MHSSTLFAAIFTTAVTFTQGVSCSPYSQNAMEELFTRDINDFDTDLMYEPRSELLEDDGAYDSLSIRDEIDSMILARAIEVLQRRGQSQSSQNKAKITAAEKLLADRKKVHANLAREAQAQKAAGQISSSVVTALNQARQAVQDAEADLKALKG